MPNSRRFISTFVPVNDCRKNTRKTSKPAGSHAIYGNPQALTPSRFTAENDEGQVAALGVRDSYFHITFMDLIETLKQSKKER